MCERTMREMDTREKTKDDLFLTASDSEQPRHSVPKAKHRSGIFLPETLKMWNYKNRNCPTIFCPALCLCEIGKVCELVDACKERGKGKGEKHLRSTKE